MAGLVIDPAAINAKLDYILAQLSTINKRLNTVLKDRNFVAYFKEEITETYIKGVQVWLRSLGGASKIICLCCVLHSEL